MSQVTKKLIFLGNSGVGKSFLCNVAVGEHIFDHDISCKSITSQVDIVNASESYAENTAVRVYNIPGLIESDKDNIARNKKCIKEAFEKDKDLPTMIFFVLGVANGGRVRNEDVDAWKAISSFLDVEAKAYNASVTFVVNKIPIMKDRNKYDAYTASATQSVTSVCGTPSHPIVFINDIPDEDCRADFLSAPMYKLSNQLAAAIKVALPDAKTINVDKDKVIELAADVMKKANEELHKVIKDQADKFEAERKKDSEEYRKALQKQQEENAAAATRERDEWQRKFSTLNEEIRGFKSDIEKHKTELEAARKKGSGDGLGGLLPFLLQLVLSRDRAAQQAAPQQCMGGPLPIMMPPMDGPSGPAMRGGPSSSMGGGMGWNEWRTAAANAGRHYDRAGQSAAFGNYKRTGKF